MDFIDIFVERAGEKREEYELAYLLGQYTASEIATELNISSTAVNIHMRRRISRETREKLVNYLPSTAAQCAEILVQVKSRALDLLRQDVIEDTDARLLNTLIGSSSKFLEKYGQVTEGIQGVNAPITINYFELACKDVLVNHPEIYMQIKNRMLELEKGIGYEVK
jgi:predicted DNA-binding protein YlxM (UPF0122 family)